MSSAGWVQRLTPVTLRRGVVSATVRPTGSALALPRCGSGIRPVADQRRLAER